MRINLNIGVSPAFDPGQAAKTSSPEKTGTGSGQLAPDTANLSGRINPQALTAALSQIADHRQDKVAALAEKVRNGSYRVDPKQTAEALISQMIVTTAA